MLQVQAKPLYTAVSPGEEGGQVVKHAPQREQQRLVRFDVEVELQPRFETVWRLIETQAKRTQAQQLVKVQLDLGTEAPGQCITRQRQYLVKLMQPHAGERFSGVLR
ncbi:hypothetical protein D3C79_803330 [compost metagenome]